MAFNLLLAAIVILACIVLNKLSDKLGIPMLLAFILLGMFFGSDGIVKIHFDNYAFAEQICTVALIFIMFYGGFGTRWEAAKPVAVQAILLSTVGVVMTAGLTGLFCHYVIGINWMESFLIGAVTSSTDAASVFSILRSKRLNLRYNTASLLEVESGSNDPFSYMLTAIVLTVMKGSIRGGEIVYMLFSQIVYGVLLGIVIAVVSVWLMKHLKFADGFDTIFVVAIALFSYAAPTALGGNGYLCVYIVGIVLGNARLKAQHTLVNFFDGVTGLMQMMVFFLLGLLSFPSKIPAVIMPALAIAVFLTLIARSFAVGTVLTLFKSRLPQQAVTSWAGLRGAASIVFAIMAVLNVETENDIFHIVFCIVLFSILIQGSFLPYVSQKLHMIDEEGDVMKTFSDYTDEIPVQFIRSRILREHPWCGSLLKDILLPPNSIAVLLLRGEEKIVPNGNTQLLEDDRIIICAKSLVHVEGVSLSEKEITAGDPWKGKPLAEIETPADELIIMIQRGEQVVIPQGNTVLQEKDILVINHS